ncbi:hypothetical protein [Gilvimarinus algae]|uniref:Uncharacterized protein n=1 Tax=Gilvimarinus algae TaxID=3058037 RepID=A0ABT8TID5_9GAMM|nr:hypothetical protein [Gilvimarinus sp. SDUM040014]MDO3382077.1 hypothetical protein [Gilvimarinus sp. SDUM040014]
MNGLRLILVRGRRPKWGASVKMHIAGALVGCELPVKWWGSAWKISKKPNLGGWVFICVSPVKSL